MIHNLWNDANGTFFPESALDFMPVGNLREVQLQRLKAVTALAYERVPLFRQRMDEKGVKPSDIHTLADVRLLPFSTKSDLRDTYPYGLFAVPMSEVVRLHASSGTTGKPIVVGYTEQDMEVWKQVIKRSLYAAGFTRGDIVSNMYGYGLFTGGLGLHAGLEAIGATVIPISGGNSERQIMVMKDFGVTGICATPSYFIHLIEVAQKMGIDFKRDLKVKRGVFGAEPWTNQMREYIENATGIQAFDIYGLSEIIGPGVGNECQCRQGPHIFEDHFLVEIVDPQTLEPLPDGQEGELVFTTLSKQAMPAIRYRTRDITALETEPCACGRTLRRIRRISRRSDDMFILRGVNVFPSQIETALLKTEASLPHYLIVLTRRSGLDQMEVRVEVTAEMLRDRVGEMDQLQKRFARNIEQITGLHAEVTLSQPGSLPRSEGKAKRLLDQRNLGA
ncbi:MAG TPA: phenylacetate--CoA ligase [Opitutaceae bacterium]|jgi:phenylacetate-CoA ligase|nr:phenylacetate--CoA ligase [Opitutaceae bacterium]HOY53939.1 phenylacetate--CoA ligase [Opitutaceae bacterium]HPG16575.1 phenylacetate--CoA ligase [Opitutaceae bacterium]HPN99861.1 phenylacetate--CoA ligase [Opitutaceae bacterium]